MKKEQNTVMNAYFKKMETKFHSFREIAKTESFDKFATTFAMLLEEYNLSNELKNRFGVPPLESYEIIKFWTVEFDKTNEGNNFDEVPYMDLLDEFSLSKLKEYEEIKESIYINLFK